MPDAWLFCCRTTCSCTPRCPAAARARQTWRSPCGERHAAWRRPSAGRASARGRGRQAGGRRGGCGRGRGRGRRHAGLHPRGAHRGPPGVQPARSDRPAPGALPGAPGPRAALAGAHCAPASGTGKRSCAEAPGVHHAGRRRACALRRRGPVRGCAGPGCAALRARARQAHRPPCGSLPCLPSLMPAATYDSHVGCQCAMRARGPATALTLM